MKVSVNRKDITFSPDPSRVIARFMFTSEERAIKIIRYVLNMNENDASFALQQTLRDYSMRHRNISKIFEKHFNRVLHVLTFMQIDPDTIEYASKILIGSFFTMEYSIESAAFFNPSMVDHPDQTEIAHGHKRVILSFRATGEGHISSIVFRTGVLSENDHITLEPTGNLLEEAESIWRFNYNKEDFARKIEEMQDFHSIIPPELILDKLNNQFTYGELHKCIRETRTSVHLAKDKEHLYNQIIWLASSHYELQFSLDTNISERVIFPVSANEKNGIEDARFVKFKDEDNKVTYYATYTAFDGTTILPKLLETEDFYHFKVSPLHGEIAQNKGMALFPRKVNGKYAMLCRIDGVNNYIAFSDNITIWREAEVLQQPKYSWELIQIGNCGSPIETEEGWLVITHGVGPMREYVLGAALYDLNNPEIEIGRSKTPLLIPNSEEREGYVPNVVYSCGSMVHNGELIIPYAMSDYSSTYATVNLKELLDELSGSM
ncbi:glycoside hydrolase family 130 protein [Saccharicrinis aurantiacus]|uniref:glycoside hydrolase family 130 protein n=1 Tax=Saccharicrinis aurantiacus TaxID=1849719 RepID=UPI00094FC6D0|nr:glycoside hydrolase family 130 protein [Saccharicrinis aurantiacus]